MLRAIIFDCDGVIADTEPLHLATFQRVLEEEGIALTAEQYYRDYLALDDRDCFAKVYRDRGIALGAEGVAGLVARKAECLEPIMRSQLRVFPGVVDFIREASRSYSLAVASGALRHEVELVLQHADIRSCFQAVVAAEDVSNGKPSPEPFLKACDLLSSTRPERFGPGECLVIEDSIPGVQAARSAGMRCVAITNSYPKQRLGAADRVIDSFVGVSPIELESLF